MRANLLGTLVVFTVLVGLTFGLPAVNRALPADRPLAAGQQLTIGNGVALVPPHGARVDVTRTLPNTGVLALVLHGLDFRAEAKPTTATLEQLANKLRGRIQNQRGVQIAGELREVRTASGVPGLRGTYSSGGRDGVFAAYVAGGLGVQVTVSGSELAAQIGAVEDSLSGLSFPVTAAVRPMPSGQRRLTWRSPALWLTVVVIGYGAWQIGRFGYPNFVSYPKAAVLAVILWGLYAIPWTLIVTGLDYLEPEPVSLTTTALAWGGLVATAVGISGGQAMKAILAKVISPTFSDQWSPAIVGPTIEETAKLLGIIMIVLLAKGQVNSVVDGVVYGAFVGLGFQLVENFMYAMHAVAISGGGDRVAPVIATFLARGFLGGLWSHTMFTALAGAGVGYALVAVRRPWWRRIGIAVLAFCAAWLLHFVWNSPLLINGFGGGLGGILAVLLVKGLPGLLLVLFLVGAARRSEARYYAETLTHRADLDLATPGEIHTLCHARSRAAARRYAKARGGMKAALLVRRLQAAQAKLAVALSRVQGTPAGTAYDFAGRIRDPAGQVARRERDVRGIRARLFGLGLVDAAAPEGSTGLHWPGVLWRVALVAACTFALAMVIRRLGGG